MPAPFFSTQRLLAAVATASVCVATPAMGQQVLVDLDFTDGTTDGVLGADTFSSAASNAGEPKPRFSVLDDTGGLDGGNALFVDSAGTGGEWYIPFANPVTLTPGTSIRYSFDVRMDTVDGPGTATAGIYAGIFADTDNSIGQQFGTFNTYDDEGQLASTEPAIFGQTGGEFDGDTGPIAPDFGMHARILAGSDAVPVIRQLARMRTENANQSGIMSGSGETVANPFSTAPDEEVAGLDISGTFKQTFIGEWGLEDVEGETELTASYTVIDADGTASFANSDPLSKSTLSTFDPTFHYIAFENVNDDFNYVIDNILIEFISEVANGLAGDYDDSGSVEQGDLNLVLTNWGTSRTFVDPGGTVFASDNVDQEELNLVLTNWGSSSAPSFEGFAVPEPATFALLGGLALAGLRRRTA
ncbi:MAG: PEP-CTERM sorting domain-containing protein [Planctomycetota bacterium]